MESEKRKAVEANAQLVIEELGAFTEFEFGYDENSVAWLDGYITRFRAKMDDVDRLTDVFGCYLGEAIIKRFGGHWQEDPLGNLGIMLPGRRLMVYPFAKVGKHIAGGEGDSLEGLFRSIPAMMRISDAEK